MKEEMKEQMYLFPTLHHAGKREARLAFGEHVCAVPPHTHSRHLQNTAHLTANCPSSHVSALTPAVHLLSLPAANHALVVVLHERTLQLREANANESSV